MGRSKIKSFPNDAIGLPMDCVLVGLEFYVTEVLDGAECCS
jgi:hypothetical protein